MAEILIFDAPNTKYRDAEMVPDWWTDTDASDRRDRRL